MVSYGRGQFLESFLMLSSLLLVSFQVQAWAPSVEVSRCSQAERYSKSSQFETPLIGEAPDFVFVDKGRKLLHLLQNDSVIRTFPVALGSKDGKKRQEGDKKTPEGIYAIGTRNSASKYHLSLEITYPNQSDIDWAREHDVSPGGEIMIHGLPNSGWQVPFLNHPKRNWTKGCVAVTNDEIEEIWNVLKAGTTVELCP